MQVQDQEIKTSSTRVSLSINLKPQVSFNFLHLQSEGGTGVFTYSFYPSSPLSLPYLVSFLYCLYYSLLSYIIIHFLSVSFCFSPSLPPFFLLSLHLFFCALFTSVFTLNFFFFFPLLSLPASFLPSLADNR